MTDALDTDTIEPTDDDATETPEDDEALDDAPGDEPADDEDDGAEPADPEGDTEPPPAALEGEELEAVGARTVTRTVNGKPVTKSVNEWIQAAQKGVAAEEKFAHAAAMRKEAEEQRADAQRQLDEVGSFFRELTDPAQTLSLIRGLGKPFELAVERAIAAELEEQRADATLTPDQKRLRSLEREIEAQRRREREREETEQRTAKEREQSTREARWTASIGRVRDALSAAGFDGAKDPDAWQAAGSIVMADLGEALRAGEELDDARAKAAVAKAAKLLGRAPKPAASSAPKPKPKAAPPPVVKSGGGKRAGAAAAKKPPRKSASSFFDEMRADVEASGALDEYYDQPA